MWRHPIKARDKSEGTTLPPLENNSRKTNKKQWGKKFSFLYNCGASIYVAYTVERTVLPNTEILPFCVCTLLKINKQTKIKQKNNGHGTILNQPIEGAAECRVSRAHGHTESGKRWAANRKTKRELLRLRNEAPWQETRTHVADGSVASWVAKIFDGHLLTHNHHKQYTQYAWNYFNRFSIDSIDPKRNLIFNRVRVSECCRWEVAVLLCIY